MRHPVTALTALRRGVHRHAGHLGPAPSVNHVALGKDGTVFTVDKSANARDAESDTILKIRPRR